MLRRRPRHGGLRALPFWRIKMDMQSQANELEAIKNELISLQRNLGDAMTRLACLASDSQSVYLRVLNLQTAIQLQLDIQGDVGGVE